MQTLIIVGLVLFGILSVGFLYLRGPSSSQMSEELHAIELPDSFLLVGTVDVRSSGSFAGDCFDSCSGGDLVAENRRSTSAADNEKNLEAADVLVRKEGWRLVHPYKDDSAYRYREDQGGSAFKSGSVRNIYCKSKMQLEVSSGLRHPLGSDLANRDDADLLAGLEYRLESRSCSY